jgi:hypothetical protein
MTLDNGVLRVTGTAPDGTKVSATGALNVGVSQTGSASTLTLTETGLSTAEKTLKISSPFDVNGHPMTVPVRIVHSATSC